MITIVIPAYNESSRLLPTLREIERYCAKHPDVISRVVIVDDGSKDATVERILYFQKRLPLDIFRFSQNKGKWAAINRGIQDAEGLILLMDADGSAGIWNLTNVPAIRHAMFGSRFMGLSEVSGKSFVRTIVSQMYRRYVGFWYKVAMKGEGQEINDMQCPWKLFWKEDVDLPLETERFSGDIEFACKLNATIINVPVVFHHVRGSKVPIQAVWKMLIETPKIARRMRGKYV